MKHRDLLTGAAFFVISAALRCAFIASVSQHPAVLYPTVDGRSYHEKALTILSGDWLGDQVFYQAPLSPYFFAGLYAIFGAESLGVLMAQAVLDAGTVALVFGIALRISDYRCALIAGLLAMFYPLFFYYDALLLKVALTVFASTAALYLFVAAVSRDRARLWFAAGCALGVGALTRGNYLLFIPVLLAWMPLANKGPGAAHLRRAALVVAGVCLVIFPVTLRNYAVGDDFVLITSQAGQNFYTGNFRGNDTGRYKPPPFLRANPFYEELDFRREALLRTGGRVMKPSELSRFWFRETLREIRLDFGHFLRHSFLKARLLFNHYEVPATNSYYFFREHVAAAFKIPTPNYGVLLPLALCGMFFMRRDRRAQLLLLFFFSYALTVILTFNMSRYRMPLVPIVILFASVGFNRLLSFVTEKRLREALLGLGFLVVCYPVVYQKLTSDGFAGNYLNLGIQLLRSPSAHRNETRFLEGSGGSPEAERAQSAAARQSALAEEQFRLGLDIQPRHAGLQKALGSLLLSRVHERRKAAEYEEALALARELTETLPRFAEGHAALGRAHSDLGNYAEALDALRRALALSPGHPGASAELRFVNELQSQKERP